jgi:two-component system cell cycle response regulator DivK
MGAQLKSAMNGTEALEILKTFRPNLILLDLSMPVISGWDMLNILRANPDTQNICTIALTAHAMPSDQERAQAAGFNGYLSKPINLPTLLTDLEHSIFAPEHTKEKPDGNP